MIYNDDNAQKGELLARGKGINNMGEVSYRNHYTSQNTILEVENPSDLGSKWKIYSKK